VSGRAPARADVANAPDVAHLIATLEGLPHDVVVFEAQPAEDGSVADLRCVFVNASLARVLGMPAHDLVGRGYFEVAPPADTEAFALFCATASDRAPRSYEAQSLTLGRTSRVSAFSPAPGFVAVVSKDVTGEAVALHLLEARERELRETQRIARLGTWNRDLVTGATDWSEQTFRIHGLDPAGPIPRPEDLALFYEPASASALLAAYERLKTDGTPYEVEVRLKPAPGRARALIARGEAVRDDDGRIVRIRGTVVDVSERVGAEQMLAELRAELALVSRRTVLGEVASSLAHELNQPLAAILSSAEAASRLIRGGSHSCDDVVEILGDIAAQTERAADVIRKLRGQLRRDAQAPEAIDLNALVRETLQLTATEARHRGAAATQELADFLPPVFGDRVQLQQVLINLFLNALDAVEKGPRPRRATMRTWAEAGRVCLSVTDSGAGIPAERLERVFEPFYSTKPGGLGVGLSISRTLAEAHGGSLLAGNAPDGGAVFLLTLPAAAPPDGTEAPGR